jgi:hypothetical protein
MEEEISSPAEAGAGAVIDHLADLVLIELLRVETHRVNETSPVQSPAIGKITEDLPPPRAATGVPKGA